MTLFFCMSSWLYVSRIMQHTTDRLFIKKLEYETLLKLDPIKF